MSPFWEQQMETVCKRKGCDAQYPVVPYVFQNCMGTALKKAINDLRETTLAARPGRWLKLLYFARLRQLVPGKYSHWGFEQRHGTASEQAMRETHEAVLRETLAAPIPLLLHDCEENAAEADLVNEAADTLAPEQIDRPSELHFRYVVASVKELLRAKMKQRE
jgi:hypothetical protein